MHVAATASLPLHVPGSVCMERSADGEAQSVGRSRDSPVQVDYMTEGERTTGAKDLLCGQSCVPKQDEYVGNVCCDKQATLDTQQALLEVQ